MLGVAAISFVAHVAVGGNYGYFRDELYYLAAGRHPSLGYVDFPALIGWLGWLMDTFTGGNLVAIHVVSALAGAALVVTAGLIARELGGGRFAQILAALATGFALVFMGTASIFSMDVIDELWWALAALVLVRLLRERQPRLWLVFGLVCGLGLLTKLSIPIFGLGVAVGLLLTPRRADLRTRWPWLGGLVAFVFLVPYLIWNAANGWPTVEFWTHYGGIARDSPLGFIANQLLLLNPATAPLWIAGLVWTLRSAAGRPYRVVGWTFLVCALVVYGVGLKSYFLAPAYPMLFAAGAVPWEGLARRHAWPARAYAGLIIVCGVLLAPLAMPILAPRTFIADYGWISGAGGVNPGQDSTGRFPQYLGDRFGWDTMTATVARVVAALPAAERRSACILTINYGEAGALQQLGAADGLPPVISGHNSYWIWGPGSCTGQVLVTVGYARSDLARSYASVTRAATITCRYCQPEEDGVPVYVARHPLVSAASGWASVKHYN